MGVQAQVDWKENITLHNRFGEPFTFQVFDYKLGYSRYPVFTYKLYKTRQDVFDCLIASFKATGGVPKEILFDNLFFQLIARRYEKNSTIITTNTPFSKWGEIFGSVTLANAVLDRLLHHSTVISIKGPSYRLKDKRIFLDTQESEA